MSEPDNSIINSDPWRELKQFTSARIALGRAGMSLTTRAYLDFQLAHALARDAVHMELDFTDLEQRMKVLGYATLTLQSQAENPGRYLQRPDLGRLLNHASKAKLEQAKSSPADAVIIVADGLSANAIVQHAEPFLRLLLPELQVYNYHLPPIHLVKYGRVAIGDVIAEHYAARLCMVLIGERPGLSSPDSMGIYYTYQAISKISTDANRNCISNIHNNGLSYPEALKKLLFLIKESEKIGFSGVNLKDETSQAIAELPHSTVKFFLE
jgi:ethanolamine ammonia-lyase small subunit